MGFTTEMSGRIIPSYLLTTTTKHIFKNLASHLELARRVENFKADFNASMGKLVTIFNVSIQTFKNQHPVGQNRAFWEAGCVHRFEASVLRHRKQYKNKEKIN